MVLPGQLGYGRNFTQDKAHRDIPVGCLYLQHRREQSQNALPGAQRGTAVFFRHLPALMEHLPEVRCHLLCGFAAIENHIVLKMQV